jgi:NADPH:quinone reductase-like Zn-dependent oxidoreductase
VRAVVCPRYGPPDVLELREIDTPVPKDNEVLIKVHASSVSTADCEMRAFRFMPWVWLPLRLYMGVRRPRRTLVLGQDLAGEIVVTGKDVTRFAVGDQVFASCGLRLGGHAEYACLAEKATMAKKPANMTYEEAAAVPLGGLNALHFLRLATVKSGQHVLVVGASGTIGTFGVQLGKHFGAEVTAVCSASKADLVQDLGADHVIDYAREDYTRSGKRYDVVFDAVGKGSYSGSLRVLKPGGVYLQANPTLLQMIRAPWTTRRSDKRVVVRFAAQRTDELEYLTELIEAGALRSAVDRCYPLEQAVEAHRYVEQGHKRGNVVISVIQKQGAMA